MRNDRFESTKEIEFDNEDIIITDPCYIIRAEHHGTTPITEDDWNACEFGSNMEALGFESDKYLTHDTIYGDWDCTVFNEDTGEILGNFCADAGLVSVFRLKDILEYNPDYDYKTEVKNGSATLIKNFTGDVSIDVIDDMENMCLECNETATFKDCEYCEYYKDRWISNGMKIACVVGEGNINFYSIQTGL